MAKRPHLISSLALRTGLLSTLWMSAVLITLVMISAFFYHDAMERNFERLLNAHLYSLIGGVSLSPEGEWQGVPDLGDIRYNDPSSGWYWEVIALDESQEKEKKILKSPSLLGKDITSPPENSIGFDRNFIRLYRAQGLAGQPLLVVESDIILETQNSTKSQSRGARFRIMGNEQEVQNRLDDFWSNMRFYLAAFIILSALINAVMIILSLRPLNKIKIALSDVRTGKASHIHVTLPSEIQPMAREINALIDNQLDMIARFRTQLGNLAHAMKTPLAILINEAEKERMPKKNSLILEQARLMQEQIQHHLQRAQMAAGRGSLLAHTDVKPLIIRLQRVMAKLFPDKIFDLEVPDENLTFAGNGQDLEEIVGNLFENAGKWAKTRIALRIKKIADASSGRTKMQLIVEDDGVGLDADQRQIALKRGQRLDENVPGSGLGLSIVTELVSEYGGRLQLDQSPLGGLYAEVILPLVPDHEK